MKQLPELLTLQSPMAIFIIELSLCFVDMSSIGDCWKKAMKVRNRWQASKRKMMKGERWWKVTSWMTWGMSGQLKGPCDWNTHSKVQKMPPIDKSTACKLSRFKVISHGKRHTLWYICNVNIVLCARIDCWRKDNSRAIHHLNRIEIGFIYELVMYCKTCMHVKHWYRMHIIVIVPHMCNLGEKPISILGWWLSMYLQLHSIDCCILLHGIDNQTLKLYQLTAICWLEGDSVAESEPRLL